MNIGLPLFLMIGVSFVILIKVSSLLSTGFTDPYHVETIAGTFFIIGLALIPSYLESLFERFKKKENDKN